MAASWAVNGGGVDDIRNLTCLLGSRRPLPSLAIVPTFKQVAKAAKATVNERPWFFQRGACFE
jgi:hypothetical protein